MLRRQVRHCQERCKIVLVHTKGAIVDVMNKLLRNSIKMHGINIVKEMTVTTGTASEKN
jgi:hypothetical protein